MLLLIQLLFLVIAFAMPLLVLPLLIWAERRICAWIQLRVGPNRVGPFGLLQPLADVIKLVFKEDVIPNQVDKILYTIAPLFAFVPGMVALAVIPMGPPMLVDGHVVLFQGAPLDVGILFLFAVATLGAYALTFGGWASRSKFSQYGGIRATAQVISYEVALGLSFIAILMISSDPSRGTSGYSVTDMVWNQIRGIGASGQYESTYLLGFIPLSWNIFCQPLAFLIFFTAALAETNRAPFDLPEAEPELVGGYHTEYSSFKFAMFFMGEYLGLIIWCSLITHMFLGGWHLFPFQPLEPVDGVAGLIWSLVGFAVYQIKMLVLIGIIMLIRWTFPRFRYDQLMGLGWKVLIPLSLANLALTAVFTM